MSSTDRYNYRWIAKDFKKAHPDRVEEIFFLDSVPEYKTPGYDKGNDW